MEHTFDAYLRFSAFARVSFKLFSWSRRVSWMGQKSSYFLRSANSALNYQIVRYGNVGGYNRRTYPCLHMLSSKLILRGQRQMEHKMLLHHFSCKFLICASAAFLHLHKNTHPVAVQSVAVYAFERRLTRLRNGNRPGLRR